MTSIQRIKGANGVIIDSDAYLELPKAPTKVTTDAIRNGMIRYNKAWKAFEGTIDFDDGSVAYRRFAQLDANGRLLTSQLPDEITSGLTYAGTYDPVQDDIDPPYTLAPLPAPSATIKGQYYIIRGIQDDAATHLAANPTTAPFVIFTPPNAAGQWTQIKYYIGKDPATGSNTIVINAFARIIVANVPATGHAGLLALANGNADLTKAFDNTNNYSTETGLSDSDWVIMTDSSVQRLRQNRVSIVASSVSFDNTILQSVKRPFVTNNSTVQGVIDNTAIYSLRRTGDSMTNDGTAGAGRLAITYGTAVAPSMTFNDGNSDPDLNSGMNPAHWTDATTGIFHQGMGSIGFSTSGVEKIRMDTIGLKIMEANNVVPATNAALQFVSSSNTVANPGFTAINDTMYLTLKGKIQVEIKDASTLFHGSVTVDNNLLVSGNESIVGNSNIGGNLTVDGNTTLNANTIIGDASGDTLTVNATSTFKSNVSIEGNTVVGNASTDTLIVNADSTFNDDVSIKGNTIIGDASTDTLVVNATSTFNAPVGFNDDVSINGDIVLGSDATDTLTVNATSTFVAPSTFQNNTTFNGNSNRFKNINLMPAGKVTLEHATTPTEITQATGNLQINMSSFANVTINDGASVRTKFNRYGIGLPILNPVDNAVGEDGMIAYSTEKNKVMQKSQGKWQGVSGGGIEMPFTAASWVLSGSNYTITVAEVDIQNILVQEASGANFITVDVDNILISPTNAVVSIPASTPDLRFAGRLLVTYR